VIVAPRFLEVRDVYYVGFTNVSVTGLQEGGAVKYHGLTVGYIKDISIDPENIQRVILTLSLDHGVPIREDTEAVMTFFGLTGLRLIELKGGSNEAKPLKSGGTIHAGRSITDNITGKAEVIGEKAELVLNNLAELTSHENQKTLVSLAENFTKAARDLSDVLTSNKGSINEMFENGGDVFRDLRDVLTSTKSAMQWIASLVESDTLQRVVNNMSEISESLRKAEFVRTIQEANEALDHMNNMLRNAEVTFSKGFSDLAYSIESLRESVDYINQFARMISEDPSVLMRGTEPRGVPDFQLEK
jgi:phospholipid/cholesterol/gamma-HCH transport system substrate-binding protein